MTTYDDWKTRTPEDEHAMHCPGCLACRDLDADEPREVPEPDWDDIRESREEARQYLREAAAADTHSSDVDPGTIDPWEDR